MSNEENKNILYLVTGAAGFLGGIFEFGGGRGVTTHDTKLGVGQGHGGQGHDDNG